MSEIRLGRIFWIAWFAFMVAMFVILASFVPPAGAASLDVNSVLLANLSCAGGSSFLDSANTCPTPGKSNNGIGFTLASNIVSEGFYGVDTSGLGDASTVSAVSLVVTTGAQTSGLATTSLTVQIRSFDWGPDITAADWRTPAQFAALPLCGSITFPANSSAVPLTTWAAVSIDPACFSPGRVSRFVFGPSNFASGSYPSTSSYTSINGPNASGAPGLVWSLTYTNAVSPTPTVTVTLPAVTSTATTTSVVTTTAPPVTSTTTREVYTGQATVTPASTDFAGVVQVDDSQTVPLFLGLGVLVLLSVAGFLLSWTGRRRGDHR